MVVLGGIVLVGSLMTFTMVDETVETKDAALGTVNYYHPVGNMRIHEEGVVVDEPLSQKRYKNLVRQAYDYSCGSAALTTVLNYYLGRNFQERNVMEGLLQFGETEKIVERRGFSLLDMKRLVTALGYSSGGFRAELSDLEELEHPAIVPIEYAGFKHFIVIKAVHNGHVYIADPALGNISFTETRFEEIWSPQVLFVVFPGSQTPLKSLVLDDADMRHIDEYDAIKLTAFNDFRSFTNSVQGKLDREATKTNPNPTHSEKLHYKRD